jgi:hypothetical protein
MKIVFALIASATLSARAETILPDFSSAYVAAEFNRQAPGFSCFCLGWTWTGRFDGQLDNFHRRN